LSAVADAFTLLQQAGCDDCYGSPGTYQLMRLGLLRQIVQALNSRVMTDPASLLAEANAACYNCYQSQGWLLELALLRQIALNQGSGGQSCLTCLNGSDTPVVAPPCACAIAYNQNSQFWFWDSIGLTWMPILL
jgi:hypothetical protein